MLVKHTTSNSTYAVRGLDLQVFFVLNEINSNALVSIDDLNINKGDGLFPYLQRPARNAFKKVLEDLGFPLTVNSAYRSVIAQTMLYSQKQRGIIRNLVAYPGKSDHNKGASVDVNEWTNPTVKQCFREHGWSWSYGMADPMHFDYPCPDIRSDSVKAFQTLWNLAHPYNKISVDGDLGQGTLTAIYNSPAEGFGDVAYPRVLKLTDPIQQGLDVGELQLALRAKGVKVATADRVFGEGTDKAVKEFQTLNKLQPDGIVGMKTRELLGI